MAYVNSSARTGVAAFPKLKLVWSSGVLAMELPLNMLNNPPSICDTGSYVAASAKGGPGFAAYVWTKGNEIFICEHQEAVFHHSSFVSGEKVRCAGMIKITQGQVVAVNNDSGHYKPTRNHLKQFIRFLKTNSLATNNTQVNDASVSKQYVLLANF